MHSDSGHFRCALAIITDGTYCKYHVVRIPKYRKKTLCEELRKQLGAVCRELARQKESAVVEGHLMVDHVHMLLSIPPKYGVSQVVGYIKGKSVIHIARTAIPVGIARKKVDRHP